MDETEKTAKLIMNLYKLGYSKEEIITAFGAMTYTRALKIIADMKKEK